MASNLNRIYTIFLLITTVALLFYLGYLFGYRETVNQGPNIVDIHNPNGQNQVSISNIQQRPIYGSSDGATIQTFGQIFFLPRDDGQTELVVNLQNVPAEIVRADGVRVSFPTQLELQLARRTSSENSRETYEYVSITAEEGPRAYIVFNEAQDGLRTASFSGYISQRLLSEETGRLEFERLVFRDYNNEVENIFVDPDERLPILVRGNTRAGISGQPAPFFWVVF